MKVIYGANKRNVHGGFMRRRKRKTPSMTTIKEAAYAALAKRIVRGTDVHP